MTPKAEPFLQMQGIVKRFPGVVANDGVDLTVVSGEIHGLLGENGAGKTTLMNVLYGLYRPDAGRVLLRGQPVQITSPRAALSLGIGMIHQHFMLVPTLSVLENIVLGSKTGRRFLLDLKQARTRVTRLSEQYGLPVDVNAKIWELSLGEQQRVEILKALYRGADLLIMDEPTAVLTPLEVDALFSTLQSVVKQGLTVIFITHKLKEVMAITRRVTVLRRGRVVDTVLTQETDRVALAKMMVGREVVFSVQKDEIAGGQPVLEVAGLESFNDRGMKALQDVSFEVRAGEILGVAGVSGNGQRELAEVLTGMRPVTRGRVGIDGQEMRNASPRAFLERGLGYIPEDRLQQGLAPRLSVAENLILKGYRDRRFSRGWFLDHGAVTAYGQELSKDFDVRAPSVSVPARQLSGGNLQKLILARELSRPLRLLIANQPTRGLDVGATEYVREKLLQARARGVGILLISEDIDEILDLADRIAVMYEGRLRIAPPGADPHQIGLMMAGEEADRV